MNKLLILLCYKAIKGCSARQNRAKKRSLHRVNEHFEPDFNAAMRPSAVCGTVRLKQVLLVCVVCFFALTGPAMADSLSEANRVYDTGDYEQAAKLYSPLAKEGNAEARYVLGMMYRAGRGVSQDYNEARKWYRLAAEQGHPIAQFYLGWIYAKGRGVPKDIIKGYMWLNIAIANADGEARKEFIVDRDSIAASMTAGQIAKAQELAKKCTAKKFKKC